MGYLVIVRTNPLGHNFSTILAILFPSYQLEDTTSGESQGVWPKHLACSRSGEFVQAGMVAYGDRLCSANP